MKGIIELKENPLMLFTCQPAVPDRNCAGPIFVGAYTTANHKFDPAKLVGSVDYAPVDMTGGKTQAYLVGGLPAGQTVYLTAILAETAMPSPAVPAKGDIYSDQVLAPAVALQAGTTAGPVNLTLRFRCALASCF